jgi:streptogramin lyase
VTSFVKSIGSFSALLLVLSSAPTKAQSAHFSGAQVKSATGSLPNPAGLAMDTSVSPTTSFGAVNVGSTSPAMSFTFTFDTQTALPSLGVFTQGTFSLDFAYAGTGTCVNQEPGFVFSAGDSCTVDAIFKPQVSGSRYGAVVLGDAASGNTIATAYAVGTGVGPQVSFPPGRQVSNASGLADPSGVVVDGIGDVFVAETGNGNVYEQTATAGVFPRTIASGLSHPTGLALDGAGNVYVTTSSGVYKETRTRAAFMQSLIVTDVPDLLGIAVDHGGNLYLTSSGLGDVHKETLQPDGTYTETSLGYGIASPQGVSVDGSGNIFILNTKDNHLYAEKPQPNGSFLQSSFALTVAKPETMAVDGNGNLYIADSSNGAIDKVTPQTNGSFIENITDYGLIGISGLAVDGRGDIFYSQGPLGQVNMIDATDPPTLSFARTTVGLTSPDSPQYVTVWNDGNAALAFPVPVSGTNPGITTGFTLDGESTCPLAVGSREVGSLAAGSSCVYGIGFVPEARGSFSGALLLTDTNLNAAGSGYAQQRIALSGMSTTSDATRTTMRLAPNPVEAGLGVTIVVT